MITRTRLTEKPIGLVACCSTKLEGHHQAQDLYQSALFKKSRAYVEARCSQWFILSAKHGLLSPTTVIESYDETLNSFTAKQKAAWNTSIAQALSPLRDHHFLILAGQNYCNWMQGFSCTRPLEGLRIGEQLAYLTPKQPKQRGLL